MPDKPIVAAYDQCTACALASQKGPLYDGPLPASHSEVCCLYRFHRQGQAPLCLKCEAGTCDGLCEHCPSRPKLPRSERAATPRRAGAKIAPRQRKDFKKLTFEIRPPKFKKKLWFGTYDPEDVARAADAINFYMKKGEPYNYPDSPRIFAAHKLAIEYHQLRPTCEDFVKVGEKKMRTSAYFARQVKEAIKAVTGKKKGQQRRQRAKNVPKEATPEPVASCASGVTSSSVDMVWGTSDATLAASSEANSSLATVPPSRSSLDEIYNMDLDSVGFEWLDPLFTQEGESGATLDDSFTSDSWFLCF